MGKQKLLALFLALTLPAALTLTSCNTEKPEPGRPSETTSDSSDPSGGGRPSGGFTDKHSDGSPS